MSNSSEGGGLEHTNNQNNDDLEDVLSEGKISGESDGKK